MAGDELSRVTAHYFRDLKYLRVILLIFTGLLENVSDFPDPGGLNKAEVALLGLGTYRSSL